MQIVVNGLLSGLTVGLLGLAFWIVYTTTGVFHIALGAVYAAVPFFVAALMAVSFPPVVAVIGGLAGGAVLSIACEWLSYSRLARRGASLSLHLVASLGLYMIIVQALVMIWGPQSRTLRVSADTLVVSGVLELTRTQLVNSMACAVAAAALLVWMRLSRIGLALRALSDDAVELALRGANIRQLRLTAFVLSGLLGGVSALGAAYEAGFRPDGGLGALLLGIVGMIVGGQKKYWGAIIGSE